MNHKFLVAIFIFLVNLNLIAYDAYIQMPLDTFVIQFPDNSESNWKEITRHVVDKEGVIELIPLNQNVQNWSDLISLQYYDLDKINKQISSLDDFLDHLGEFVVSKYSPQPVTWNIIERNNNDIIYEWILQKPYKDIPIQHEVARASLRGAFFHRIGFTKKFSPMSCEERKKYIKLLKENCSLMNFKKAQKLMGLSFVEKIRDSVILSENFNDWKAVDGFDLKNGFAFALYLPPTQNNSSYKERLEVGSAPAFSFTSINQLYEAEKEMVRKNFEEKIGFHILEETPNEIIYFYNSPYEHLRLNAVVRTVVTEHGYYNISYKIALIGQMQKEEILKNKEKLKAIKFKFS